MLYLTKHAQEQLPDEQGIRSGINVHDLSQAHLRNPDSPISLRLGKDPPKGISTISLFPKSTQLHTHDHRSMLFISFIVFLCASLAMVGANPDAGASSSATVVTATRLVKELAQESPYFLTSTEVIVWTQTPEPTPSA
ncbi:hypothetical protein EW146_g410 [Bondarzewia mesenterica]|uniref:Uncharacterized protein n=1 Tax=Bondarzewia mesenterica TaxID=1095465 RepID=A0A4S4M905_9AGAM|nr:hypothetical protein EW146_g410 [Bondarzewia mesenterica]